MQNKIFHTSKSGEAVASDGYPIDLSHQLGSSTNTIHKHNRFAFPSPLKISLLAIQQIDAMTRFHLPDFILYIFQYKSRYRAGLDDDNACMLRTIGTRQGGHFFEVQSLFIFDILIS